MDKAQVLKEIMVVAGDPAVTEEAVKSRLEQLHFEAEQRGDQEGMALIVESYHQVSHLRKQVDAMADLAAGVQVAMRQLVEQKKVVEAEYKDLTQAVNEFDTSHPQVGWLIDMVREGFAEDLMDSGAYLSNCPGCDITEEAMIPIDHEVARQFHDIITGGYQDEMPEELLYELAEFIVGFVDRAQAAIHDEQASA